MVKVDKKWFKVVYPPGGRNAFFLLPILSLKKSPITKTSLCRHFKGQVFYPYFHRAKLYENNVWYTIACIQLSMRVTKKRQSMGCGCNFHHLDSTSGVRDYLQCLDSRQRGSYPDFSNCAQEYPWFYDSILPKLVFLTRTTSSKIFILHCSNSTTSLLSSSRRFKPIRSRQWYFKPYGFLLTKGFPIKKDKHTSYDRLTVKSCSFGRQIENQAKYVLEYEKPIHI
ncbi:hypothetical protein YC2023_093574 [Brassica napus]